MSAVAVDAVVTGPADAPVVVLSNSLGATYQMWNPQIAALEERFRVVRYNTRGHGGSPVPDGRYSIDDLADDLVALLDRLGVGRAHLVGLSLGGMTALRVAARDPDRVDRLAVLCTGAQLPPASGWTDRAATVRSGGSGAVATAVVERWFTPEHLSAHPEVRQAAEAMVAATPAEGYAGCCEAIAAMDLRDDLASITAPTLAIAGAEDPATPPPKLEEIATRVKNGQLLVVPRAAHLANAERPGIITPALIEHLEEVMTLDKLVGSAAEAVADIPDGASLAVGGFGLAGIPWILIEALLEQGASDLTIVSNNCGVDGAGLGLLLEARRISRVTASYVGENKEFARQFRAGELTVELTPQGTLAERLRAGGSGVGAFFTPTGVGTLVAEGGLPWRFHPDGSVAVASSPKEVRTFHGREMVLEESIVTDYALIRAAVADKAGNCRFHASARNFNPPAAMSGRITIVEAEQVVEVGELDPDGVHLPGIFVKRIVALTPEQASRKDIEKRTTRPRPDDEKEGSR